MATVGNDPNRHKRILFVAPDGKAIASAGPGGSVVLHHAATGKKLRSFQVEADAHSWTFAPDGKTVAAGVGDRLVCVWEASTGKRIRQLEFADGPVHYLAFSHDGRTLAGGVEQHAVKISGRIERAGVQADEWAHTVLNGFVPAFIRPGSRRRAGRPYTCSSKNRTARQMVFIAEFEKVVQLKSPSRCTGV